MSQLLLLVLGALALFISYSIMVLRYRARLEHRRERDQGLDPLR